MGKKLANTDVQVPEWNEGQALRLIAAGTAAVIGNEFFNSLVTNVAAAMQVYYAFVAEFSEDNTKLRTIAFWAGDKVIPNFTYDLKGTPCEEVVRGSMLFCPTKVADRYPEHRADLEAANVDSYLGVPLVDANSVHLGHLAIMDTKSMIQGERGMDILKIFAARARVELERIRAERIQMETQERLAGILNTAMDVIVTVAPDRTILLFNKAAVAVLQCQEQEAIGDSVNRFLSSGLQLVLNDYMTRNIQGESTPPILIDSAKRLTARRNNGGEFPVEATLSSVAIHQQFYFTIILRDISERIKAEAELRQLNLVNTYLKEEIEAQHKFSEIIGNSLPLRKALEQVEKVSASDTSVLIMGETGTGKESIARAIHNLSRRRNKPMIKVNCAALPSTLVESELFGHEKGAFTGALTQKIGRFELAHGGTIFLDEIGDVPLETQLKLLRVLQEREIERIGSGESIKVDVRVIAATNRDLLQMIADNKFRADLYYRLNVFPIRLPPLRERKGDIPALASYFIDFYNKKIGRCITTIPEAALDRLMAHDWPGNIRELENIIERAVVLATSSQLEISREILAIGAEPAIESHDDTPITLEEAQRRHIQRVLALTNGVIDGANGAAKILDIHPNTLRSRMEKLGMK